MSIAAIIDKLEAARAVLRLDGEKVRVWYPDQGRRQELAGQVAALRASKDEVAALLLARSTAPAMPRGVRLLGWNLKEPPLLIESCAVITDVRKFVETELRGLDARLHAPVQIRGGPGIFTILDRLAQCGVELEIVLTRGASP